MSWDDYWDARARAGGDAYVISGFESRRVDPAAVARALAELAALAPADRVLEVGCGAALVGRHLAALCAYTGTDRSAAMVARARELSGVSAARADAHDLPYAAGAFDVVFAWNVFHYFPDRRYARAAVHEMRRLARRAVVIADLPVASDHPDHLILPEEFFQGWKISPALYSGRHPRFTASRDG